MQIRRSLRELRAVAVVCGKLSLTDSHSAIKGCLTALAAQRGGRGTGQIDLTEPKSCRQTRRARRGDRWARSAARKLLRALETRGKAAEEKTKAGRRARPESPDKRIDGHESLSLFVLLEECAGHRSAPPRSAPGQRRSRLTVRSPSGCLSKTGAAPPSSWHGHVVTAACPQYPMSPPGRCARLPPCVGQTPLGPYGQTRASSARR